MNFLVICIYLLSVDSVSTELSYTNGVNCSTRMQFFYLSVTSQLSQFETNKEPNISEAAARKCKPLRTFSGVIETCKFI